MTVEEFDVDRLDENVDVEISKCLNPSSPKSFFLFAGAGSGKTRSLVNALDHVRREHGRELRLLNKKVAVVTYTKKARDEIISRLQYDPLFQVSTIHAFAWSIIQGFNSDIREWLRTNLSEEISELEAKEAKGRKGTKTSTERIASIASKTRRLSRLDEVSVFVYNPDGDNRGKGSLNHSEVLKMTGKFVSEKPTLQKILRDGFPFILIDESQDTNKHIINAMFSYQAANKNVMALGLFGDMMQRIYSDGVADLGTTLPSDWATPVKKLNFRCPRRVIGLLNKIREATDRQIQVPASKAIEGVLRMYILPSNLQRKPQAEAALLKRMAEATNDPCWEDPEQVKSLILEHKMAASRLGFLELFAPLYGFDPFKTPLRDGDLPCVSFFVTRAAPLIEAKGDKFAIARVVNKFSPLLSSDVLKTVGDEKAHLKSVQGAVTTLLELFKDGADPKFIDVLKVIKKTGLFAIPDVLQPALAVATMFDGIDIPLDVETDEDTDEITHRDAAIGQFLEAPFSQLWPYKKYVAGLAPFDTHQGVKGLEFPRVMVIMDDAEAAGFTFKYEKLFSASAEDGVVGNTRRLFYVTCSRAEESLCLVAYSENPAAVRSHVISQGWFTEDEVISLNASEVLS